MKHLCCALPFVLLGYSLSLAVKPYQPTYENTIEDLSLWTTYPELSGKGLLCLEIDEGDKLWFGAHSGVYAYDGMEWSEYPVPQHLLGAGISHIAFSHDGALYAGSDRALSRFVDGQWTRILPAGARYSDSNTKRRSGKRSRACSTRARRGWTKSTS